MDCPDENAIAAFVERRLPPGSSRAVIAHVDRCDDCRRLVAAAARAASSSAARAASSSAARAASSSGAHATTPTLPMAPAGATEYVAGDRIGRYQVVGVLGAGGMGVVYGAFDPELQRKVALKLVRADFASLDDELRARLVREAQAMARVRHPNVITVFDVGSYADRLFVAMEVIDGTTLAAWQSERTRTDDEILRVVVAAGRGLAAAHAAGLVHRDFKPDNVLIGHDGRVCVTDFGLARPVAEAAEPAYGDSGVELELTQAGTVVGTPAYMAPEQMRGAPPDERADQFSFCVTLFEALYGVRPFAGKSVAELERAILDGERVRPPRRGVPSAVRRALQRGLRADPATRFPTMDALIDALAPPRTSRRGWLVAALLPPLAVAAAAMRPHTPAERVASCSGAGAELAGVWNAERRAAVESALGGGDRFARVAAGLDAYAARWSRMHRESCEATRVRKEQSEALYELRSQCLEQRREEAGELVRILATDHTLGDKAAQAVHGLTPVEVCANAAALERPRPPPRDVQRRLEPTQRLLARARAELLSYQCAQSRADAAEAAKQALALDAVELLAQAKLVAASGWRCLGDLSGSDTLFFDAALWAARAGDETLLAQVAARAATRGAQRRHRALADAGRRGRGALGRSTGRGRAAAGARLRRRAQKRARRAIALHRRAQSYFDRVPGGELDRLRNLGQLGVELSEAGQLDESRQIYERVRDRLAVLIGPDSYLTLYMEECIALNDWERDRLEPAIARERAFLEHLGSGYPSHWSTASSNLGWMLVDAGRPDEAVAEFRRALGYADGIGGEHAEESAYARSGLGAAWTALGKPARARPLLEAALVAQTTPATAADRADTELALARALWATGGDRARARALAERARDYFAAHPLGARRARDLAEADRWLREHRP